MELIIFLPIFSDVKLIGKTKMPLNLCAYSSENPNSMH